MNRNFFFDNIHDFTCEMCNMLSCYTCRSLASKLCKSLAAFSLILLLLVDNNCILPAASRDAVSVTVFNPLVAFVWFYMLKTSKRSHDDYETFVMICS